MNWIDHGMGWGWPGMILMWIVYVLLIIGLVNLLAGLMERGSSQARPVGQQSSALMAWITGLRRQFQAWRRANAEAHAQSKPGACCSAPPPGSGKHFIHGIGKR